jgi:penicillin-binding protein 2
LKEADRIAAANLMPSWLKQEQKREDSIRAFQWFKITKDSSFIHRYVFDEPAVPLGNRKKNENKTPHSELTAMMADNKQLRKKQVTIR